MDYKLPKLPNRPQDSNKGSFGKVINISGSDYMSGAAYLSSIAALKIGAGYVKLISTEKVIQNISIMAPEVVTAPLDTLLNCIKEASVILIGCGLSITKNSIEVFKSTITNTDNRIPIIIDADGLNILAQHEELINYIKSKNTILTPHPKEASRLLDCTLEDILQNPDKSAKLITEKYNCITVLKTHKTTVISPDGEFYKNTTGCSALAKAGSGDILAGIIAGLVAQKMKPFEASILGVHLHGLAGELAAKDLSEYGVLASDTLRYIPIAIKNYLETTSR